MRKSSLRLYVCALLLSLSGCAHRYNCTANLSPADPFAATKCAKLEPFFADWQGKLALRDWKISYSCERRKPTSDGEIVLGETELPRARGTHVLEVVPAVDARALPGVLAWKAVLAPTEDEP